MPSLRAFAACVFTLVAFSTTSCSGHISVAEDYIKFDGNVKLYAGAYYDDLLLSINIHVPNRCYNIDCDEIANRTASAKWSGLPTTGWVGKAFITFYADKNCKGSKSSALLPHNGGVREFVFPKLKGDISSFMVRSESRIRRQGSADVCDWSGAKVAGGSVSEDGN